MSTVQTSSGADPSAPHPGAAGASGSPLLLGFSWLVVGAPLVYGVWQTLVKAAKLFTG